MNGRAPARPVLAALLGLANRAIWLLALNCLQNFRFAPRATAGSGRAREPREGVATPLVSILVPARDEAANIAACLRGLLGQTHPATEIVVCDDCSTDSTAAIVQAIAAGRGEGRLRLLAGRPLPVGWSGKNWACHQLAGAARGDWLLFTDADTRHRPGSVAAALALARQHDAGLVSLLPRQVTGSFGERLLLPQLPLIVFAVLPIALVGRRAWWTMPFAGANGLYLFFRRDWYDTVGGYDAVRSAIAEDMRFAVETKRRGGGLVLADGGAVLDCRMYGGFADAWRGCSRNAFPAALESVPVFGLFAAAWALLFVLPPLALASLGAATLGRRLCRSRVDARVLPPAPTPLPPNVGGAGEGHTPLRLALAATGGQLVVRFLVGRRYGRPTWEVVLQPVGSVLVLGVLLNSYRLHRLGGGAGWRGRRYA